MYGIDAVALVCTVSSCFDEKISSWCAGEEEEEAWDDQQEFWSAENRLVFVSNIVILTGIKRYCEFIAM